MKIQCALKWDDNLTLPPRPMGSPWASWDVGELNAVKEQGGNPVY